MRIKSRASFLCLLSLFLVGAVSLTAASQVQFFDTNGNLITNATVDMVVFDEQSNVVSKETLPADPDGTYDVAVPIGTKVSFMPTEGEPSILSREIQVKMQAGVVPVFVPSGAGTNDTCATPTAVGPLPATVSGDTIGSTPDAAPVCGTNNTSPGVWYSFTGTGNNVTVSVCPAAGGAASYDSKLTVYCSDCITCIGGNDDFCGLQSQVTVQTVAGTVYKILVHGFLAQTGTFTLRVIDTGVPSPSPVACPVPPPPTGACCNCICAQPENCTQETEEDCAALQGEFQGNDTSCFVAGTTQHFHATPGLPIPDNSPTGANHTISVVKAGFVTDVNVNIGITHTWVGDLVIQVTNAECGVSQEIWSRVCGSTDNINATADDSGTESFCAPIAGGPIHSVFYPPALAGQGPLAVFNGCPCESDWTIHVEDQFPADVGTLNFWGVDLICGVPFCALANECTDEVCGNGTVGGTEQCDPPNGTTCDDDCQIIVGGGCLDCAPGPDGKVTICHIPPGNPENAHTINVSPSALPAHCNNHGDTCGECDNTPAVHNSFGTTLPSSSGVQDLTTRPENSETKGTRGTSNPR